MPPDSLKLFDDIERTYLGPSKFSEARWIFMNRTALPGYEYLRVFLQNWFDDYQTSSVKRYSLWKNFHSDKDDEHLSAFFELYLCQLFKAQSFKVEIEPEWESKRPDFLLSLSSGQKILLEATGLYPENKFSKSKKQEQLVIDYLNEHLHSPNFFLHIRISRSPVGKPPSAQILRQVEQFLSRLNYDEVVERSQNDVNMGLERFPSTICDHQTWSIEIIAIPKKDIARGKPGMRPVGSMFYDVVTVNTASHIKHSIDRKYGHYGDLNVPYLLALNVMEDHYNEESLLEALFGEEITYYNLETGELSRSRKPNGSWVRDSGHYQKQRMSAVCVFNKLRPETMDSVNPIVWHH
ncbi:MAG TPA: hypothetical protein VHL11_23430, partial [Phototrophicaceae bacterium]|nr:hypothetical protein [Phototrophicaceae bacterium]